MAQNVFAGSAYGIRPTNSDTAQTGPQQFEQFKSGVDTIASETGVPANVLLALEGAAGANAKGDRIARARQAASLLKQAQAGGSVGIEDALASLTGDKATAASVMTSAYDIADRFYPQAEEPATPKGGILSKAGVVVGDLTKRAGGALISGAGGAIDALGSMAQDLANTGRSEDDRNAIVRVAPAARKAARPVRDFGAGISSSVSETGKEALAGTDIGGDLFTPSTWTFGENPSVRGFAMLGADVLGSMLPTLATAVVTKNPTAAAAVGGSIGAGAAQDTARQMIDDMDANRGSDGISQLERESKYYQALIAQGKTKDEAKAITKDAAARTATWLDFPVSAAGGAATEKIISPLSKIAAGRGMAARVGTKAALSAAEEGSQEAAETIATRHGANLGAGTDESVTDGTFADFILGALGGAPAGAIAGIPRGTGNEDARDLGGDGSAAEQAATPVSPSGDMGVAADEQPTAADHLQVDQEQNGTVASDRPQAASMEPSGAGLDPIDEPLVEQDASSELHPAPKPVPLGPIASALSKAPDLTPVPAQTAPAPRFPDQKAGGEVRLYDPDADVIRDAVVLGESPTGIRVRIDGGEIDLDPQAFDQARVEARTRDSALAAGAAVKESLTGPAQPEAEIFAENAQNPEAPAAPDIGSASASQVADQDATGQVAPSAPVVAPEIAPEDRAALAYAQRRLAMVNARVERVGMTTPRDEALHEALTTRIAELEGTGTNVRQAPEATQDTGEGGAPVTPVGGAEPARSGVVAADAVQPVDNMDQGVGPAGAGGQEAVVGAVAQPEPRPELREQQASAEPSQEDRAAQLRERISYLQEQARSNGWTGKIVAERNAAQAELAALSEEKPAGQAVATQSVGEGPRNAAASVPEPITISPVSEKLALLRGIPEDGAPEIAGMKMSWNPRKGGFTFPSKQAPKVQQWIDAQTAPSEPNSSDGARGQAGFGPSETVAETQMETVEPDGSEAVAPPVAEAAASVNPEPTDAQKEAGNYTKGHTRWNGLDLSIENAQGGERSGTGPDGSKWSVTMPAHYGYFRGTEGNDGDHVDFYMGPNEDSGSVFVVDQNDAETGKFDEHKVMLGFPDEASALAAYDAGFSDGKGPDRRGAVTAMSVDDLKEALADRPRWQKPFGKDPATEPGADGKPQEVISAAGEDSDLRTEREKQIDTEAERQGGKLTADDRKAIIRGASMRSDDVSSVRDYLAFKQIEEAGPSKRSDLSLRDGEAAYRNMSHFPEQRAEHDVRDYVKSVNTLYEDLLKEAKTDAQKSVLESEIDRFRQGYIKHQRIMWAAKSRTASFAITGAARFPVAQNNKRMDTESKRVQEFLDWEKRAKSAIRKAISTAAPEAAKADEEWNGVRDNVLGTIATLKGIEDGSIRGTDPTLIKSNLKGRIERLAKNGKSDHVVRALDLLRGAQDRFGLKKPVFTDRAEIWKYGPAAEAKAKQIATASKAGPSIVGRYDGAEIERNMAIDRIRIHFDAKPDTAVIDDLKAAGWRWSRSDGVWQRKATNAAEYSARSIVSKHYSQVEESDANQAGEQGDQEGLYTVPDVPDVDDEKTSNGADTKDGASGFATATVQEQRSRTSALEGGSDAENVAEASDSGNPSPQPGDAAFQRDMRPVVATLTGDELGPWEDIRQLGRKAEAWYRENLIGGNAKNEETGWVVLFNKTGARKVGGRKGDVLARIVPAIPDIISKGHLVQSEPDTKGRGHIKQWHTFAARVIFAGAPRDVVVKVAETEDGKFHYDLSRDNGDGALFSRGSETAIGSEPYGFEDNPVTLNIDFAEPEINAPTPSDLRKIAVSVTETMAVHGLHGKVSWRAVRGLMSAAGVPALGAYRGGEIRVNDRAADPAHTTRHEIIHALRDAALWDSPYGLFSQDEWRALVKAVRGNEALRRAVDRAYPELPEAARIEEMVAEAYADWARARDAHPQTAVQQAFERMQAFFRALASALRGEGFVDAAMVMERIASGEIGGRGPDGGASRGVNTSQEKQQRDLSALKDSLIVTKAKSMLGKPHWRSASEILTDAMSGNGGANILALVPGRALFTELGKRLSSARTYQLLKEEMDALRNDWHGRADDVSQRWLRIRNKDKASNDRLMDLMHRTTLAGIDPSRPDTWRHTLQGAAEKSIADKGTVAPEWAFDVIRQVSRRANAYAALKAEYDLLPPDFRDIYREVRRNYSKMADDFETAVIENMKLATQIAIKRAERKHKKEIDRIRDEGLEGEEQRAAIDAADAALAAVKKRGGWASAARMSALRKEFESNRLKGPYFPLARFGQFFVTIRDEKGKVVSFSRFESASRQKAWIKEATDKGLGKIQHGVLGAADTDLKKQVDPQFLADVEGLLAEAGASKDVMDQVWQRWLETLPDQSIRTSKIHRKGQAGYNQDAFRAFGSHMFHGAHQLARLKYGLQLEEALDIAQEEAQKAEDPNRAGLVVDEMRRRHAFTMNPTGAAWTTKISGSAFIWYLGLSPASALANLSQTTVVGIPIMATHFRKAGAAGTMKALAGALKDYGMGRGRTERSKGLSVHEQAALAEAFRRGTIDKTQAHDLAGVADSGVEYSARREKVMKVIGVLFHETERLNREVTFLASYRLARGEGQGHEAAIETAADMTWKVHFDYQNNARPRIMQSDVGKALTVFRNFTVNMLYRLFRDAHQAFKGATEEDRREARGQLIGITLSMMAQAGIKGTWGYGLAMLLLGMFFPGGDDDAEKWLQDSLLMEGDDMGTAAWNYAMGAALNGAPGQMFRVDLSERIGMPNMWFRGPGRDLEAQDTYDSYVQEILGPTYSIPAGIIKGITSAFDGDPVRGVEAAAPAFARNPIKAMRYGFEGVTTRNGDTLVDGLNPLEYLAQAIGFTPAKVAERYDINNRLKNAEKRITDERSAIQGKAAEEALAGNGVSPMVLEQIRDFNRRFPEYPITSDTIRQSARGKARSHERNEAGISLNPKLDRRLREAEPPMIY